MTGFLENLKGKNQILGLSLVSSYYDNHSMEKSKSSLINVCYIY